MLLPALQRGCLIAVLLLGGHAVHPAPPARGTGRDIAAFALSFEGVQEKGANNTDHGGPIDAWHKMWGFLSPVPWCGIAVGAWHVGAGVPRSNIPESPAWSPSWSKGRQVYYTIGQSNLGRLSVREGSTGTLYYRSLGRVGHVFLILKDMGRSVETIEGNTGAVDGSRETVSGRDGVFRKWRRKSSLYSVGYFGL